MIRRPQKLMSADAGSLPWRVLVILVLLYGHPAFSQPKELGGTMKSFRFPQYYDDATTAAGQKQIRSLVSGSGGRTLGTSGVLIEQAKVELFRRDGVLEFTASVAEQCQFDLGTKLVTSSGPLTAATGDGRLTISGRGFAFSHEAMSLVISNEVATVLLRETNAAPMHVTAASLDYQMRTNRAVYRGGVVAEDPQVRLTTGELTVSLLGTNAGLESLTATGGLDVADKLRGGKLRADSGRYDAVKELVEVQGNTSWSYEGQTGRADALSVEQRTTNLLATGNVQLRLPRGALSGGLPGLSAAATSAKTSKARTNLPPASDTVVTVMADRLESKGDLITLNGGVRVSEEARLLTCEALALQRPPEGGLAAMRAAGGVVASEGARQISSERAEYSGERQELQFIGSPEWRLDAIEGRSAVLRIDTSNQWIHAESNVLLRITATNSVALFNKAEPPKKTAGPSGAPRVVEVESGVLDIRGRTAVFDRDVTARELPRTGAEARLSCPKLELLLTETSQQIERLTAPAGFVAERGVPGQTNGPVPYQRFTAEQGTALLDAKTGGLVEMTAQGSVRVLAPEGVGSGDRAVYQTAEDAVTLTGNPSVVTPRATIRDAAALIWNPSRNSLRAVSPYKMLVPVDAKASEAIKEKTRP